jgi:hypothetical protein
VLHPVAVPRQAIAMRAADAAAGPDPIVEIDLDLHVAAEHHEFDDEEFKSAVEGYYVRKVYDRLRDVSGDRVVERSSAR